MENAERFYRRRQKPLGRHQLRDILQLRHDACADGNPLANGQHQNDTSAFTGAGPAVVALLGGQIDAVSSGDRKSVV